MHDEQLTPAEFFDYISVEISSNLNFMAEARKRPRPSQLGKLAETDDHDDLRDGFAGDRVAYDPDSGGVEAQDEDKRPLYDSSIRYCPVHKISTSDCLAIVHRTQATKLLTPRAQDT